MRWTWILLACHIMVRRTASIRNGLIALLLLTSVAFPVTAVSAADVTVDGAVTSAKGPVTKGTVYFFASCQDYAANTAAGVATITSGRYSASIPAGTYLARIEPRGGYHAAKSWHSAAMTCEAATSITVTANTTVDLLAAAMVTLQGTVRSADGPVTSGRLTFFADCASASVSAEDTNLTDGFNVEVAPGSYRVKINNAGAYSWHSAKNTCSQATAISATTDATLELVAAVTRTITVKASSANGPVTTATVSLYNDCSQVTENVWSAPAIALMTNGSTTITLAAGTYVARIDPAGGQGALLSWHAAKARCEDATPVTIQSNDTLSLTATPDNNVSGSVTTKKGPVAKGYLAFFTSCQAFEQSSNPQFVISFEGGTFRGTVQDGSYVVRISNFAAGDSWHSGAVSCAQATPVTVSGLTTLALNGLSADQSVTRPPKAVKRGKKVRMARTTDRGTRVTWTSLTPRTCVVKKSCLLLRARGWCKVKATSPAGQIGLTPLNAVFKIKVR